MGARPRDRPIAAREPRGAPALRADRLPLALYSCLQLYCDLHNDGAIGAGDQVGPYEIEHIDFDALVDRFFLDTDFLLEATLLSAEEAAPGHLLVTRQAWKIAARLRPEAKDLRVTAVACPGESEGSRESVHRVPASGYVGPYPLREREEGGEDEQRRRRAGVVQWATWRRPTSGTCCHP